MILHELKNRPGAIRRRRRIGRGPGSTLGKTAGRGQKGQRARNTVNRGFEGGQTPLRRRLPRRGFKNPFKTVYHLVNLRDLQRRPTLASMAEIGLDAFVQSSAIRNTNLPVKVLGTGNISRAVTVHAHRFSKSAVEKIEAAGGRAVVITGNASEG